jgi:hypothetical protein
MRIKIGEEDEPNKIADELDELDEMSLEEDNHKEENKN